MGTPEPAAVSLRRLIDAGHEIVAVYTQPDRPSGRGNKITSPPVKDLAVENWIEVHQPTRLRDESEIQRFRSLKADVAVVVAYGRILPIDYLNAFRYGAINLHFSLLPKYRGAAPVNWAIVNGESETGVTTMKMDVGLDTGPVLLQRSFSIGDDNSVELMARSAVIGADLLIETLVGLDSIDPIEQDHEAATLAPIMKKADGLVDWGRDATDIVNRIRGFQPFPGSYSFFSSKKVNFWRAVVAESTEPGIDPGTITRVEREFFSIACGSATAIDVYELQLEGKRRMASSDVFNGRVFSVGDRFDVSNSVQ